MRKTRLIDCEPKWVAKGGRYCGIRFSCPEGHTDCFHVIPFTPALDGQPAASWYTSGATWQRTGGVTKELGITGEPGEFETLTLSPSIRRVPTYTSREDAVDQGVDPAYLDEQTLFCALHIFIRNGQIEFCGDSK